MSGHLHKILHIISADTSFEIKGIIKHGLIHSNIVNRRQLLCDTLFV